MTNEIDRIFEAYERGRATRRDVLTAIASLLALGGGVGCASASSGSGEAEAALDPRWAPKLVARGEGRTGLNHVNVRVADVERSFDFYQRFFGLGRVETPTYTALDCGGGTFISLQTQSDIELETFRTSPEAVEWARTPGEPAGTIEHFCLEVEDFDLERTRAELLEAGHEAVEISGNLLTADPDGALVQIVDADLEFLHEGALDD